MRNKILFSTLLITCALSVVACGKKSEEVQITEYDMSDVVVAEVVIDDNSLEKEISDAKETEKVEEIKIEEKSEEKEELKEESKSSTEDVDVIEEENKAETTTETINETVPEKTTETVNETKLEENKKEDTKKEDAVNNKEEQKVEIPSSFDPIYYANNNPDVVAAYGSSAEALYKHYVNYGKKEGRAQNASEAEAKKQQASNEIPGTPTNPSEKVPESTNNSGSTTSTENEYKYEVYVDTEMLNLINNYRAENQLPALSWNSSAESVAKDRILAIAKEEVLSHDAAGGPPANCCAENLYWGTDASTSFIFNGYKSSPGHDSNMKSSTATSCVIATVRVTKHIGGLDMNAGVWNIQIYY